VTFGTGFNLIDVTDQRLDYWLGETRDPPDCSTAVHFSLTDRFVSSIDS
jgi:hypothetical protein